MNEKKFIELVTRYLSKEASIDETEQLNSLLKQKKYSTLFNVIEERWTKAGRTETSAEFDSKRGLELLTAKIRKYNPSFKWDKEAKQKYFFSYQSPYFRIAASIAVLMILATTAFFIVDILNQRSVSMTWNEKKTVMGENLVFTLLDGTRITLNADSKLKYPVHFGEESREVFLEGEAYFEVTHDADKPFVVHTGDVSTTNLGTRFNINAFPNEENITVSLEEGKIKVSTNESNTKKLEILLISTQQLIYNKEKETSTIDTFDIQKVVGWKDNILVFDDKPLSTALISLERSFGVRFEIANQSLASRTIKANFRNESLWTVVEVIEKATGFTHTTIEENNELKKIVFQGK